MHLHSISLTGGVLPAPGDVLFKGSEVGKNGSIAWILSNYFSNIANNSIDNIVFDGSNIVKIEFRDFTSGVALAVGNDIGITSTSQIRIKNFYYDPRLNLTWTVYAAKPGDPFNPTNNYCHFQVIDQIPQDTQPWENIISGTPSGADQPTIEFSNANFKEVGVIGGEALRTETETIGDYKLGINTICRSSHDAYANAFVENLTTDPRANLDVVGNAYISGRKTPDYLQHTQFADRDKNRIKDALIVGGDSAAPNDEAVLRVSTETSTPLELVDQLLKVRLVLMLGMMNLTEHWLSRVMQDLPKMYSLSVILKFRVTAHLLKSELTSQLELLTS